MPWGCHYGKNSSLDAGFHQIIYTHSAKLRSLHIQTPSSFLTCEKAAAVAKKERVRATFIVTNLMTSNWFNVMCPSQNSQFHRLPSPSWLPHDEEVQVRDPKRSTYLSSSKSSAETPEGRTKTTRHRKFGRRTHEEATARRLGLPKTKPLHESGAEKKKTRVVPSFSHRFQLGLPILCVITSQPTILTIQNLINQLSAPWADWCLKLLLKQPGRCLYQKKQTNA